MFSFLGNKGLQMATGAAVIIVGALATEQLFGFLLETDYRKEKTQVLQAIDDYFHKRAAYLIRHNEEKPPFVMVKEIWEKEIQEFLKSYDDLTEYQKEIDKLYSECVKLFWE